MIPDWHGAPLAARGALAPGGFVHVVDFGDLAGLPPLAGRALKGWLRQFHVAPREALLQAFETGPTFPGRKLSILPGRYAFLLTAGKDDPILG
jgi:S-adenosylmethionine-diacylgycerolhomoserine-N-methlytransferase